MTGTAIAPAGLIAGRRMTKPTDKRALEYRILQILAEHRPQSHAANFLSGARL